MADNGHADVRTDYGRAIVQYDFGRFYIFVNTPDPDYDGWSMAVYDGDTKRSWGGMRHILFPDQLHNSEVYVEVTDDSGESWTTDITDLILEAYQEVEGEDARPIPPNFSELSDDELIEYVEGGDGEMDLSDLRAIREYVDRGSISREQASSLLAEWLADRG